MTTVRATSAQLLGVSIGVADPLAFRECYRLLTGVPGDVDARGNPIRYDLGGIGLSLVQSQPGASAGLFRLSVGLADPPARASVLRAAGADLRLDGAVTVVATGSAHGVELELRPAHQVPEPPPGDLPWLDHVALLVADISAAVNRWSDILGVAPPAIAPHPLGGSDAARFHLGRRMIEIVSPWPGEATPTRRRLETSGDGPIALAIVQGDLPSAVSRLAAAGVPLIDQPPHVFVHPKAAGGVLVQLTPRVEH